MKLFFFLTAVFFSSSQFPDSVFAKSHSEECLKAVRHLIQQKDTVASQGGIWALFEANPALRKHSSEAIQLDSRISKTIVLLEYLCKTEEGVPLNELAVYVSTNVKKLGAKHFKEQLIIFGKPETEIDNWLAYSKIAQKKEKRTLDYEKIKVSMDIGKNILADYIAIGQNLKNKNNTNQSLREILKLHKEIDIFFNTDSNMALALQEQSQVPYWDVHEDHGGS